MASFRQIKHVNRDEKPVSFSNYAPFAQFYVSLGRIYQNTAAAVPKKQNPKWHQWALSIKCQFAADYKWRNVPLIFTFFFPRLLWNKELGAYESCRGGVCCRISESQINPDEPRWAVGHLFSAKTPQALAPYTITPPSLPCLLPESSPHGILYSSHPSSFVLDYSHPVQATRGCQQATTAATDGSPGLRWLPYVASVLCDSAMLFFESLISFSLSSEFTSWLRRREPSAVKGWPGSNSVPINTFQREVAGIRSQLEVYLFRWMIMERLKTAGLKRARFTANKPTGDHLYASERLSCPWKWTRGEISHHNSFAH